MGKESIQTAVAADRARDATQLKAEHGKEMAALKAEEAQLIAAQKAEHAKTPGKTGLLAKLTGKEDPVKKAEKQELKAEIARAENQTKAEHDAEDAQLKARGGHGLPATGALPAAGMMHGGSTEAIPDNKIYNHATGEHGQAALLPHKVKHDHGVAAFADNGLGDRGHHSHHHHSHRDGEYNGGLNHGIGHDGLAPVDQGHGHSQGQALNQGQFVQGQAFQQSAMPLATHSAPLSTGAMSAAPLATHSAPLSSGMSSAPLAAHSAPSSTGASNVAVIAPSHNHGGNRL